MALETYVLTPLPQFGVEAHGIDLKQPVHPDIVTRIKEDVTR